MERLREAVGREVRERPEHLYEHADNGTVKVRAWGRRARQLDHTAIGHTQAELFELAMSPLRRVNRSLEDRRESDLAQARASAIPERAQPHSQECRQIIIVIVRKASREPCVDASLVSSGFHHF